ncbi:Hypothetical predicted protein [Olea europaea subsp. europaea]|uniref:Uncharacterized protein n=1 Tax=Olea europaea subsp. europaea TaxID=158383 RepID=A0A8S0V4L9_OLEEU|nr:Hypothetical predicted protein [Olea europaea subsp. europaea]
MFSAGDWSKLVRTRAQLVRLARSLGRPLHAHSLPQFEAPDQKVRHVEQFPLVCLGRVADLIFGQLTGLRGGPTVAGHGQAAAAQEDHKREPRAFGLFSVRVLAVERKFYSSSSKMDEADEQRQQFVWERPRKLWARARREFVFIRTRCRDLRRGPIIVHRHNGLGARSRAREREDRAGMFPCGRLLFLFSFARACACQSQGALSLLALSPAWSHQLLLALIDLINLLEPRGAARSARG